MADGLRRGQRSRTKSLAPLGLALSFAASAACNRPPDRPQLVLWAWERPEDLRFIDPLTTGVAALIATIRLRGDEIDVSLRRQSLRVPVGAQVTAVVRIESDRRSPPTYSLRQLHEALDVLFAASERSQQKRLQIDFDAVQSERSFYRRLLSEVRARRPAPWHLSMTALASWCLSDAWIADLPVDEAVPMLFSMGPEGRPIIRELRNRDFSLSICRGSVGLSTDEHVPFRRGRTIYLFHSRPWTADSLELARGALQDWVYSQ